MRRLFNVMTLKVMKNILKVNCKDCRVQIISSTAKSTDGFCMPCFKKKHNDRTPASLSYITKHDLNSLEESWNSFMKKPFPINLGGTEISGVCISSLSSNLAGYISSALCIKNGSSKLSIQKKQLLKSSIHDLEKVIEHLTGEGKLYFEELLYMIRFILNHS